MTLLTLLIIYKHVDLMHTVHTHTGFMKYVDCRMEFDLLNKA